MASEKKQLNCAIYTRKSSEEGLEQEFNSLDAQREACEAYIRSQKHEGWMVLNTQYNDGGFSGGNMDRPGLVQLLADIRDRKVDVVVVYKVDRLTRALSDFAKIVETFDAQGVSFVSVTQQFNTTTSMGRLTLNVLLSFAQFEREVTGERIRDKIAASRRKGMWMGGNIPLGYDLDDRKLVVNAAEAETVRTIFRLYIQYRCVRRLKVEVERLGLTTKSWVSGTERAVGGKPFSRGHLYYLLKNRVYLGEAVHKGTPHAGQHDPIIDQNLWDQAQAILQGNRSARKKGLGFKNHSPLAGIIFDDRGNRLTPSHTGRKGERYRYYVSQAVLQNDMKKAGPIKRVPAQQIEDLIERQLAALFAKSMDLANELFGIKCTSEQRKALNEAVQTLSASSSNQKYLNSDIRAAIVKVTIGSEQVTIAIDKANLRMALCIETSKDGVGSDEHKGMLNLKVAIRLKRGGRPGKVLISEFSLDQQVPQINAGMIKAIVRAHKWDQQIRAGASITAIAKKESVHRTYVGQILPLANLAPDITEAILDGRQPEDLKVEHLLTALPNNWANQRKQLGFAA